MRKAKDKSKYILKSYTIDFLIKESSHVYIKQKFSFDTPLTTYNRILLHPIVLMQYLPLKSVANFLRPFFI